jgi:hypothetical protein
MSSRLCKFDPSRTQRIAAIRDIVYEYANLMAASHYSIHGSTPWRTNCDDAFLLGCRKFDEFLMRDKRTTNRGQELDDVLAIDYLPQDSNRTWSLPLWTRQWKDAMNKQLAHIAYSRGKKWNHMEWVLRLEAEFRTAWWRFQGAVVNAGYRQEFAGQLASCQNKKGFKRMMLDRR